MYVTAPLPVFMNIHEQIKVHCPQADSGSAGVPDLTGR